MNTKTLFITGASSGIGYATALAAARRGWNVIGTARRVERLAELEQAVAALPSPHGEVLALPADVTQAESLVEAVRRGVERFGRLDVVIANAGLGQRGALVDSNWADLEVVLRTNIDGLLHTIRASVSAIQKNGGQVVLISSVAGQIATPYTATYAATKAFVSSLARSLRLELEEQGIAVTDMLVGRTDTEFNEKRRGAGARTGSNLPTMTSDQVAESICTAIEKRSQTVVLRPFDRLILLGNTLAPWLIARLAKKQYK
ncbi:MAG: SDR family NAD(P)-dependent oxidoreductase [Anaerolineae bacterium]|nr:SDR family NAD(P)-dependent oxidoreductase [Anaerolineae bacterium]